MKHILYRLVKWEDYLEYYHRNSNLEITRYNFSSWHDLGRQITFRTDIPHSSFLWGLVCLIFEVFRSHTNQVRLLRRSAPPVAQGDNYATQQSQETNFHVLSGIQNHEWLQAYALDRTATGFCSRLTLCTNLYDAVKLIVKPDKHLHK
jgi:hypothetical protein